LQRIEHAKVLLAILHHIEYKQARSFSILPLCSFDAKHVTIDTTAPPGLLKRIVKRTGGPKPAKLRDFLHYKRAHWAQYFDLRKAEGSRGSNARRTCEWMLKTDGYAVSVLFSKPTSMETSKDAPKVLQPAAAARGERAKSE
jgi:hypothetical protein